MKESLHTDRQWATPDTPLLPYDYYGQSHWTKSDELALVSGLAVIISER